MSDLQPGVLKCETCPNLTRPHRTTLNDYPGTVSRVNQKTCMACSQRMNRKAKLSPEEKLPGNLASLEGFMNQRRARLAKLNPAGKGMASVQHLEGLSWGANIYIQVPGQRLPWRFTKATATGWKRTDGLARPNQWVDHEQLADLGEIVDPPWKEKPDDGQTHSS